MTTTEKYYSNVFGSIEKAEYKVNGKAVTLTSFIDVVSDCMTRGMRKVLISKYSTIDTNFKRVRVEVYEYR